jgi:putative acetyltransferase
MDGRFSIQEAAPAEVAPVVGIVRGVLGEYEIPVCEAEVTAELGGIVEAPGMGNGRLWVLRDGGAVVGCVAVTPLGDGACELKRMYLLPEHRGKGLGRQLLNQALAFAREQGFKKVELETHTKMEAARALYRGAGFQPQCSQMRNCGCDQSMSLEL